MAIVLVFFPMFGGMKLRIKFYKMLRVKENIFSLDICRGSIPSFDIDQKHEAKFHINTILNIQRELLNKNLV